MELLSVELNKDAPSEITLSKSVNFNNSNVILIDDVANSGKTLTYAFKTIVRIFIPERIQTLVLVERTYKKFFLIKPDYIGLSIATDNSRTFISVEIENNEVIGVLFN